MILGALVLVSDGLLGTAGGLSPRGVQGHQALLQCLTRVACQADHLLGPRDLHVAFSAQRVSGERQAGGGDHAGRILQELVTVQQGQLRQVLQTENGEW